MWRSRSTKTQQPVECSHTITRHVSNAGLERVVCEACGRVSVRYVEEVIVDDIVLSDEQNHAAVK